MVPRLRSGENSNPEGLILNAIQQKRAKGGPAYASGKTLIVFMNAGAGPWHPNRVTRQLAAPLLFECVWVVGLYSVEDGNYVYGATLLELTEGQTPTFLVSIGATFESWTVDRLQ